MKLAVFLRAPEVWGAERSLLTLINSQAAKAHTIDVYVSPGSPLRTELDRLGIAWLPFHFVQHRSVNAGGLRHSSPASLALDVMDMVLNGVRAARTVAKYDAVLTFGLWETPEIALAGRLSRTPVIFDFHVTFSGRPGQMAIKQITRLVSGVIAPAAATYLQAGLHTTAASPNLMVVPRPVSTPEVDLRAHLRTGPRRLRVGIFGQVDERKGITEVIDTLLPLRKSIDLIVVGLRPNDSRSNYEETVVAAMKNAGAAWLTLPRTNDVPQLMAGCDVVLNMSRHEAFGRTVVEAASVGTLPVVMGGGGPEEIVNDMRVGKVVHSWEEFRAVMEILTSDASEGKPLKLTSDQVNAVRLQYSPSVLAEKYFACVEKLAVQRSPSARRAAAVSDLSA